MFQLRVTRWQTHVGVQRATSKRSHKPITMQTSLKSKAYTVQPLPVVKASTTFALITWCQVVKVYIAERKHQMLYKWLRTRKYGTEPL